MTSGACIHQGRVARAALGLDIGAVGDVNPRDGGVPGPAASISGVKSPSCHNPPRYSAHRKKNLGETHY